jgi:hypothetical protein
MRYLLRVRTRSEEVTEAALLIPTIEVVVVVGPVNLHLFATLVIWIRSPRSVLVRELQMADHSRIPRALTEEVEEVRDTLILSDHFHI